MAGCHADEMAVIRNALSDTGDILIYGCDFGAGQRGLDAVNAFANATGADVAASNNDTGAADLGGDWVLEISQGKIDTTAFNVVSYGGVLADSAISGAEIETAAGGSASFSVFGPDGNEFTLSRSDGGTITGEAGGAGLGRDFGAAADADVGAFEDYTLTASQGVSELALNIGFLNNNADGAEELRNFQVFDTSGNDITSSVTFTYVDQSTGITPNSNGIGSSGAPLTFNQATLTLSGMSGAGNDSVTGAASQGILTITASVEIGSVTFTRETTAAGQFTTGAFGVILQGLDYTTGVVPNEAPVIDLDFISAPPTPGQDGYSAFAFTAPIIVNDGQSEAENGVGNGETATYENVGTFNGRSIDIRGVVVENTNANPTFNLDGPNNNPGDNANVNMAINSPDGRNISTIRWEIIDSETGDPVAADFTFLITDLDAAGRQNDGFRGEKISVSEDAIDAYVLNETTDLTPSVSNGVLTFQPSDADPGTPGQDPTNAVQLVFSSTSSFEITYDRSGAANFTFDGNFTPPFFTNPETIDTNPDYADVFTEGGPARAIANDVITIIDDGNIASATITITNPQSDDRINIPSNLPPGITVQSASDSEIILTGLASPDAYEAAILAITFENTSPDPNETVTRLIDIVITDDGNNSSNLATASMQVVAVDNVVMDPPMAPPTDTDDDGVPDDIDIDDDNDGILDVDEGLSVTEINFFQNESFEINNGVTGGIGSGVFNGNVAFWDLVWGTADFLDGSTNINEIIGGANTTFTASDGQYYAGFHSGDGSTGTRFNPETSLTNSAGNREVIIHSLATPLQAGVEYTLTLDVANYDWGIGPGQDLTSGLEFYTIEAGSDGDADGDGIGDYNDRDFVDDNNLYADGTVVGGLAGPDGITFEGLITGIDDAANGFTTVSITFTPTVSIDRILLTPESGLLQYLLVDNLRLTNGNTITTTVDTDSDGIADHLDIDSDNDGIPDNIEAQRTIGYIAPNADDAQTLRDNSGLNSAYVPTNGLEPVDTDSDGDADYIDIDSDDEGGNDTAEAGLGTGPATGLSTSANDADGDGLFDVFDTQNATPLNDGFNVNESLTTGAAALPDADGDAAGNVPLAADVDFRDAQDDTPTNTPSLIDLNGSEAGNNYSDVFAEDADGVQFVNLAAVDSVIADPDNNISSLEIAVTLPADNDGERERLVLVFPNENNNGNGLENRTRVNLFTGQINGPSRGTIGDTEFVLDFDSERNVLRVTNAEDGAPLPSDDLTALLRLFRYVNESQNNRDGERLFEFRVTDPDGTVSSTTIITVTRVNDAPVPVVLSEGDPGFNGTVTEVGSETPPVPAVTVTPELSAEAATLTGDEVRSRLAGGETAAGLGLVSVRDLLGQLSIDDAEQTDFGIGVIQADENYGRWQYLRTDLPDHEWTDFQLGDEDNIDATPVPEGDVLLLDINTVLRFIPSAGFAESAEIQFRIWDGTEGMASNPPSTTPDDSGGVAPFNASSLSSAAFNALLAADTDGDNIINANDVDDDNDGILDRQEMDVIATPMGTPLVDYSGLSNGTDLDGMTVTGFGGLQVTHNVLSGDGTWRVESSPTAPFVRPDGVAGGSGSPFPPVIVSYTFDQDVENLTFSVRDLDEIGGSERVIVQAFRDGVMIATTSITPGVNIDGDNVTGFFALTQNGSNASFDNGIIFNWAEAVDEIRVITDQTGGHSGQGTLHTFESGAVIIERDTDADGIADHLDIDSDNDGIPDNIEAQTTDGYIAPSGVGSAVTDLNMDGLDDNYDNRTVTATTPAATLGDGGGLTPVNTDGADTANVDVINDTTPDYLDTDSDGDGADDGAENGLTPGIQTGLSTAMTDADGDGLFDVFETAIDGNTNDGFVVNEGVTDPLTAQANANGYLPDEGDAVAGSIVPLDADLNFRDAVIDDGTPVAENDALTGAESDMAAPFDVFANNGVAPDSDPNGDMITVTRVLSGNDVSALDMTADGTGVATPVAGSGGGLFTVNADGTSSFDANGEFEDLAVGETRTTEIVYQIDDGDGGVDTAIVTYTVTGENDLIIPQIPGNPTPPTDRTDFIPDQMGVDNMATAPLDLNPFFDDPDATDVVTFSALPADLPPGLTLVNGVLSGALDDSASQGGVNGVYNIPVTVTDSQGDSFVTTVTYTVTNPVPDAVDDTNITDEDNSVSGNVIVGSDSDPDGDMLTVSQVNGASANVGQPLAGSGGGVFTLDAMGGYTFDPNGEFEGLDVGEMATTTLIYQISDGEGGVDTATVTLTVTGVNDAPELTDPMDPNNPMPVVPDQTGDDSAPLTPFDASDYFTDPDGEVNFFDLENAPSWMSINAFTGVITGTPPADASQGGANSDGVYPITIVASDNDGEETRVTINYTIANPAPIAVNDMGIATENGSVMGNVITGSDSDPDGDALTVSQVDGDPANVGQPLAGTNGGLFTINPDGTFTFDSNGDFEGLDDGESDTTTITYEISDGEGGVDTATVTITVTGENDPPVVTATLAGQMGTDSVAQVPFDTSTVFDDVDGDTLSFTSPDIPIWMTLDPTTGIITGTPPADASQGGPNSDGVYVVTIVADDGDETVSTSLTYSFINPPPELDVPTPDMTALDGETISIPTDFSDPDGDTLTYTATGLPSGLSLDPATGEITGTIDNSASQFGPNSDGVYTITVTADDGEGGTVSDSFTLTVTNPVPDAVDDAFNAPENDAIDVDVITGSDSDPDGDDLTVINVNGDPVNIGQPVAGTNGGLFTVQADGTASFDPNGEFETLKEGEIATSQISYEISDGEGGTDIASVTVTIIGSNDAPIIIGPLADQTGSDAAPLAPLDASSVFDDVEGDTLAFSSPNLPSWMSIDPVTGLIMGTPSADASQGGPAGDGVYVIEVVATDPDGASVSAFVTYAITNPPPMADNDSYTTPEDVPITVNIITENDSDPDGDVLVVDAAALPDGTALVIGAPNVLREGVLTIAADGTVDFDPALNYNGPLIFGYTVSDGQGGTDVASVTFDVTPVNDPPIPVDPAQLSVGPDTPDYLVDPEDPREPPVDPQDYIPGQTGTDDRAVPLLNLTPYFGDPDVMEPLVITVGDLPPGLSFDPQTGTISGTPSPTASQGGPNGDGVYDVPVTATDPSGESFTTIVTYTITNPAPIAVDDGVLSVTEDRPTVINVLGNDTDPDGDSLAVTQVNGQDVAAGDVVGLPEGGTVTVQADGALIYTPPMNYNGPASFTYTISDGEGGMDTATVNLDVIPVNDPPNLVPLDPANPGAALPPRIHTDGEEINPVDISTGFEDIEGDPLNFTADGLPPGLTLDPETGIITGIVGNSASVDGPYNVTVTATDPSGDTVSTTFIWDIENVPPVAVNIPGNDQEPVADDRTLIAGDDMTYDIKPLFSDPDTDSLRYTAEGLPPGLRIDSDTGIISGVPTVPTDAPVDVTVTVFDDQGGSASTIVRLTILDDGYVDPKNYLAQNGYESPGKMAPFDLGATRYGSVDATDPYEWVSGAPSELRLWFAEYSLAAKGLDGAGYGDSNFRGGMVAAHVPGYGHDCAHLVVEAVAFDHHLDVQLSSSLAQFCDVTVKSWTVSGENGRSLPSWVNQSAEDMVHIQRPLDQEAVRLRVKAILDDGRSAATTVEIDLRNATVTQVGDVTAQGQTLSDQLVLERLNRTVADNDLLAALAG